MSVRAWSCDTFVATPVATRDGRMLLGKNSDRPVSDCQPLRYFPRRRDAGPIRLAYREIPDVEQSYAHLGGQPYWCWGHELGLNEWGVAIGNEALYTRDLAANVAAATAGDPPPAGLVGMELVRLGLERATSAEQAVTVMGALIDQYGQWGSGVPGEPPETGAYDNSFLIADPGQAWVLETSGRRWVAKRIEDTWSISNQQTIRTAWDLASTDLVDHARRSGWWPADSGRPFDVARAYADPHTPLQASHLRLSRSRQLLADATAHGGLDLAYAKRILRDHYEDTFLDGPYFSAALPDFLSLCMHSHPADFTWGNTAASAIFVLPADGLPYLWWTPLTPCTGLYLPVFVDAATTPAILATAGSTGALPRRPDQAPADSYDPGSYWWRFHRLLETIKGGELAWHFNDRQPIARQRFDILEQRWRSELPDLRRHALALRDAGNDPAMATLLAEFTESCVHDATITLDHLLTEFGAHT